MQNTGRPAAVMHYCRSATYIISVTFLFPPFMVKFSQWTFRFNINLHETSADIRSEHAELPQIFCRQFLHLHRFQKKSTVQLIDLPCLNLLAESTQMCS